MAEPQAPKVFVSHASEDKDRFVISFARKLRENGVDAWVDQWEMAPGDSLVDKIFEEGLKAAQAIIIILSTHSVNKPWVREELNAGVVNRITRNTKIIPVIIDDCDVPESLRSTLWEKIADLSNYDPSFRKIVNAIFDISEKPALGVPPRHIKLQVDQMPGLSKQDTTILRIACEASLNTGSNFVQTPPFRAALANAGFTEDEVIESIQILEDRLLVDVSWVMGGGIPFFKITTYGFENYAKFYIANFNELIRDVLLAILNQGLKSNGALARHLGAQPVLIEYILDILESRKYLKVTKVMGRDGDNVFVRDVTPQGRRFAEGLR